MKFDRGFPRPIPHGLTYLWVDRFLSFFEMRGERECWPWTGTLNVNGYGVFSIYKEPFLAHRITAEVFYGPIPIGMEPDHLCRNKRCVNPEHLEIVTFAENRRRAVRAKAGAA